jgi:hypothetical protein
VSVVKREVVSEVLRKYDICVCAQQDDVSDTTKFRHNSTKPEVGISYAN